MFVDKQGAFLYNVSGYISRWYGDGQFLVFFDEDDETNWLDGDMSLIGKFQ